MIRARDSSLTLKRMNAEEKAEPTKEKEVMMSLLTDRMIRAAKLDVNVYEEVETDKSAMGQAMWVVGLSSVAAGIGSIGTTGVSGLLIGTIVALIGWFVWAFITYFVGTKILPEPQTSADYGELLRTIGFSSSPGVIRILGIIPFLGRGHQYHCRDMDAYCHGYCCKASS